MTLAIHHALRTSERATQFIGRFQTAPRLRATKSYEGPYRVRTLSEGLAPLRILGEWGTEAKGGLQYRRARVIA